MPAFSLSRRDCLKALLALPWLHAPAALAATSADRIVAINWLAAETLLSLGITPLAISDVGYFRRRIAAPVLPANVLDIGPYWEPNIEFIAALKPTLILSDRLAPALSDSLNRIAPVQIVEVYPATGDLWSSLLSFTASLGRQLSASPQAVQLTDRATAALRDGQRQLRPAAGQRILVVVRSQDGKYVTVYGKNSLPDVILTQLGLRNAWDRPVGAMGTANISIEKLASLPADGLFYTELPTTLTRISRLRQPDGLWQKLPIVAAGRARELTHFFPFGGLTTAVGLAQHLTTMLTAPDSHA